MLVTPDWTAQQSERNRYVRFRTDFTFDRLVPLTANGRYRILDFGCGEGHSLEALLRRFPNSEFVAADFASVPLDACARFFGADPRLTIIRMHTSEDLSQLGDGYDVIQLNAVFEHLLPQERPALMATLWKRLAVDGYMVLTETPWRWFPIETHCTSWPFVNYLPAPLALAAFRRCGRFPKDASMEYALRDGLRGATVREIVASLNADPGTVEIVGSKSDDAKDQLERWWHGECRQSRQKQIAYSILSGLRAMTGISISPWLTVVLRKSG